LDLDGVAGAGIGKSGGGNEVNDVPRGLGRGRRGFELALFLHFRLRLRRRGKWFCHRELLFGDGLGAVGLEAFEVERGLVMGAFDAGDKALQARKGLGTTDKSLAAFGSPVMFCGGAVRFDIAGPDIGFGLAETAEPPRVFNEVIDEFALAGVEWLPGFRKLCGESFELGGIFARDDEGLGVDAGFQSVEADGSFGCESRGSGGTLGILSIGFYLFQAGHVGLLPDLSVRGMSIVFREAGLRIKEIKVLLACD
jgi:hypothetical protein